MKTAGQKTAGQKTAAVKTAGVAGLLLARTIHAKPLMRESRRELRPLLPHLAGGLPAPVGAPAPAGLPGGPPAGLDALAAWLITVGLGGAMMTRWMTRGGLRRGLAGRPGSRPVMNLAHLGLAVAGLLTWIGYLATGLAGLAWTGCVLLLPVTGLGMSLLVVRPAERPVTATVAAATPGGTVPAPGLPTARHLPVLVLAAHVAFAVATMLLALLAAVGAG